MDPPLEIQPDGSYEIPEQTSGFSECLTDKMAFLRRHIAQKGGGKMSIALYSYYCAQFDAEVEKTLEECNELLKDK
jgi:hypothetical protein